MNLSSIMDFLGSTENLVALGAAGAAVAAIITIAGPLLKSDQFESRLKSVSTHREKLRQKHREAVGIEGKKQGLRASDARGFMRNVVDRLQLDKLLEDPDLESKMMQAGLRGQRPIVVFYFARLLTPVVLLAG
jgi:tight adherence protein C